MVHSRIKQKTTGRHRWRQQAASRRRSLRMGGLAYQAAELVAHSKEMQAANLVSSKLKHSILTTLRIGDFIVGHDGDPQLLGHPEIRY